MKKKLKIMGLVTEDNAIGYYRIWQKLTILENLGLANLKMTPNFDWGKTKREVADFPDLPFFSTKCPNKAQCEAFAKGCKDFWPDIILAQRHDAINYVKLIGALHNYKVPIVVDTDDDVHAVRPFNPGYSSYMPDSDARALNIKLMSITDVITTSTEQLKERHLKYNKPIYVVPNSIDIKNRTYGRLKRKDGKVRIGWFGSSCHWENLNLIQQAVKDIIANYPQVEFYYTNLYGDIWSSPPPEIQKRVHPICERFCNVRHTSCKHAYVTFDKYAKFVNSWNLDIGLAPLYDNLFNRSKSNLRILEYWSDRIAVVASPVRPYKESIVDKENGLLALEKMDWYNAIERLVVDKELREKLQANGWRSLNEKYDARKNAVKLYETYREIIKDHGSAG